MHNFTDTGPLRFSRTWYCYDCMAKYDYDYEYDWASGLSLSQSHSHSHSHSLTLSWSITQCQACNLAASVLALLTVPSWIHPTPSSCKLLLLIISTTVLVSPNEEKALFSISVSSAYALTDWDIYKQSYKRKIVWA